jgi:hypothetical protein
VALGAGERVVRGELGPPEAVKRGFLHYCVTGGGQLLIGQPGDRSGALGSGGDARTVMLATNSPAFTLVGRHGRLTRVTGSTGSLRAAFPRARGMRRVHGAYVWRVSKQLLALTSRGHVRYLVAYTPTAIGGQRALMDYLKRAIT